jgi:deoxyadenosine/deoxycytidine kinase
LLSGNNYENKKKYAVPFQMLTFLTITYNLMGEMQRMTKDKIVIIERSPISNIEIFGRMLYDDGIIGEAEWSILKYMANLGGMTINTI